MLYLFYNIMTLLNQPLGGTGVLRYGLRSGPYRPPRAAGGGKGLGEGKAPQGGFIYLSSRYCFIE